MAPFDTSYGGLALVLKVSLLLPLYFTRILLLIIPFDVLQPLLASSNEFLMPFVNVAPQSALYYPQPTWIFPIHRINSSLQQAHPHVNSIPFASTYFLKSLINFLNPSTNSKSCKTVVTHPLTILYSNQQKRRYIRRLSKIDIQVPTDYRPSESIQNATQMVKSDPFKSMLQTQPCPTHNKTKTISDPALNESPSPDTKLNLKHLEVDETPEEAKRVLFAYCSVTKAANRHSPIFENLAQLAAGPKEEINKRIQRMNAQATCNYSAEQIEKLICKEPQILLDPEQVGHVTNTFLQWGILEENHPKSVPITNPKKKNLTSLSVLKKLNSTQEATEWHCKNVQNILVRYPQLIIKGWKKLESQLLTLQQELGISKIQLQGMINKQPSILVLGNLKNKMQHILSTGWFSYNEITELIQTWPKLLTFNIEGSFKTKMLYLFKTLELDSSAVQEFPQYLSYDLYNRIIPRFKALQKTQLSLAANINSSNQKELSVDKTSAPTNKSWKLSKKELRSMLSLSDQNFLRHFNITYATFLEAKLDAKIEKNPQRLE